MLPRSLSFPCNVQHVSRLFDLIRLACRHRRSQRGRLITHNSILRLVCTHIPKLVLVSNSLLFRCFNLCPGNSPAIPPASPPASFTLIRHQYERTLITAPANSELSPLSNADSLPLFLSHPILPVFPMPMITPLSCHSNRCAPVHVLVFDNIKI